jgi:RNA polymerase sigma-70 factor, ECF subfamily
MRKRRWAPSSDVLPDPSAGEDEQPDAQVVARETIESAFLAAVRVLPAKQRATLILREVLGFSAIETAQLLDDTVPAVNSALQRARATLRRRFGSPDESRPVTAAAASAAERALLQRFLAAYERDDTAAIVDLLRPRLGQLLIRDERRRRAQRHRRPRGAHA